MNEQYAVLQFAPGVTGEESLLSWAGVIGQIFNNYEDAAAEARRVNKIRTENGLPAFAFVCKGQMTQHLGFVPSQE